MDNDNVSHPPQTLEQRVAALESALTDAAQAVEELSKTLEATVIEVTVLRDRRAA